MGGKKKYINVFGSFTEPFNSLKSICSHLTSCVSVSKCVSPPPLWLVIPIIRILNIFHFSCTLSESTDTLPFYHVQQNSKVRFLSAHSHDRLFVSEFSSKACSD